jgi:hypothetical protein
MTIGVFSLYFRYRYVVGGHIKKLGEVPNLFHSSTLFIYRTFR